MAREAETAVRSTAGGKGAKGGKGGDAQKRDGPGGKAGGKPNGKGGKKDGDKKGKSAPVAEEPKGPTVKEFSFKESSVSAGLSWAALANRAPKEPVPAPAPVAAAAPVVEAVEEEEKKDRVGVVEEDIATHQLKEVVSALEEHNKVPVDAFEVQELRKLERECTTERAKKRQRLNAEVQEKVNEKVRFLELQFAKEYAKSEAQEQAFAEERKTLTETIEQLRAAIRDQKRLTGDLAVAAAQPPPINVVRGN
eukprot:Rhum_TRINITY_DN14639_c3_g2::Rhum_TRINITY_DN14639_c3_g2_i1::g.106703::m.106703